MAFAEYEKFDGLGLAGLIRRGEVSALEVVEAAIERIEARDGRLHAVVQKSYQRARQQAQGTLPDGPFRGVPFLLKDLLAQDAGQPTLNGTRLCRGMVADHDSELVARHKKAGLVIVGKTATPELGILPVTEAEVYGAPTRNPWDPMRTPGGSSGGAGAAVASGMVPLAHASDGGGSIRIPASCCGLFGLKPTRARTPLGPDVGDGWHGLAVEHCLSRTVRDSAALLDATQGLDLGAPYGVPAPERPYLDEIAREPGRLRIAFTSASLLGKDVHRDCVAAVRGAAGLCRTLGHELVEDAPQLDRRELTRAYLVLVASACAAELEFIGRLVGKEPTADQVEPGTWFLAQLGRKYRGAELSLALHTIHAMGRQLAHFFERHDLLLTPTLAAPPLRIGELKLKLHELAALRLLRRFPSEVVLRKMLDGLADQGFEFAAFTAVANLAGVPAMSVPLHWNAEGLPIGAHFIARYGDEATLFRLAAQLEKTSPWANRRPSR